MLFYWPIILDFPHGFLLMMGATKVFDVLIYDTPFPLILLVFYS